MSRMLRLVLVMMALAIFAPALYAQNAVVLGTVYDSQNRGLGGITVLLENKATNFSRVTTTAADGTYSIAEVPPAPGYKITALKEGAELDTRPDIEVNVGDERSILPALREKGAPAAAGTDTAPAPGTAPAQAIPGKPQRPTIVRNETTATSIGSPTTSDQLRTLPLYNRNFLSLGLLAPNTKDTEAGSPLTGASFSISGLRPSSNNFLLDGFDNVASNSNQAIPFQVNEAIQEFRVTSATANAEFGRGAAGIVSVVTRRGTNQMHGALFGYFANNALNSDGPISVYRGSGFDRAAAFAGPTNATALAPVAGSAVSPRTYNQYVATAAARGYCTNSITVAGAPNTCAGTTRGRNDRFDPNAILANNNSFSAPFFSKQFGGNLGGPIKLLNNLLAFVSYEATLIDNPTPIFERVPTAFDRQLRQARTVAGTTMPQSNYAVSNAIVNLFPQSNVVAVPGVLEFYQGFAPNYTNVHNVLSRLDYTRGQNTYNLRYTGQILKQLHDSTLPEQATYEGNGALRRAQNQNAAFTWTRPIGAKLTNELRVGITQFRVTDRPQDSSFNATTLGLPNTFMPTIFLAGLDTQYSGAAPGVAGAFGGWYDAFWAPTVTTPMLPSLDGIFPFARLGAPLSAPSVRRDTTYAGTNNLSWRPGSKHSFKFGIEYRFIQNRGDNAGFSRGIVQSGNIGAFTSDSEGCNTGAATDSTNTTAPCGQAFLRPSFDYALNSGSTYASFFESHNYAGYAQDQWKVGRGFTVNVGVRYEFFGVPKERNNQIWNFQPDVNGLVQQGTSTVLDPYGYICQPGGSGNNVTNLDSTVRNRTSPVFWSCGTEGNPNLLKQDYSDFAGRGGIAWDVFGNSRTVIRGGVGIFYDQVPIQNIAQLTYNRPTQLNISNPRFIYGQNFLTQVAGPGGAFFANPARPALVCQQCGLGVSTINTASPNYQPFLQGAASPFVLYARAKNSSATPYTRQTSLTIQHNIKDNLTGELGYIGTIGRRIPFVNNTGYENEWFCTSSRQPVTGTGIPGTTAPTCDNFSYYPVFTMANIAESNYHSLMARTRLDKFYGLRMNATYTWSKAMDNASSNQFPLVPTPLFTQAFGLQFFGLGNPFGFSLGKGGNILGRQAGAIGQTGTVVGSDTFSQSVTTTGAAAVNVTRYSLPQNPLNALEDDHGRADFDVNHRIVLDFNYEVPFFKKGRWGGWQMSGIFAAQSGQPYTIFSGPLFGELTQRVSLGGELQTTGNPNNYFATGIGANGIILPAVVDAGGSPATQCGYAQGATLYAGTVGQACTGNTKRNQFTGPNYINLDLAIQKGFKVFGEGRELSFRTEVFNVFNRSNFYNPNSIASLDGFNVNPEFGQIKSAKDPRQFQFAVRFTF